MGAIARRVMCGVSLLCMAVEVTRCGGRLTHVGSAERATVAVTVAADGSVTLDERLELQLSAGVSELDILVFDTRADDVSLLSAAVDGKAATVDVNARAAVGPATATLVASRRGWHIRWSLPTPERMHTLEWRIRATRALELANGRGLLRLPILTSDRGFDVGAVDVTVGVPDASALDHESGIVELGWSVASRAEGFSATRTNLPADQAATLLANVAVQPGAMTLPAWQEREDRTREFLPAFVAAALFILIIGVGVVWIVEFQYPRTAGTIGVERQHVASGLRRSGLAAIVFALPVWFVAAQVTDRYGPWPYSFPLSIGAVGILLLVHGSLFNARWAGQPRAKHPGRSA